MTRLLHLDTVKYPIIRCVDCGRSEQVYKDDEAKARQLATKLCHTCGWWADRLGQYAVRGRGFPGAFTAEGKDGPVSYHVGDEPGRGCDGFRGYGGRKHVVVASDGKRFASSNLWSATLVPLLRRPQFPIDALILVDHVDEEFAALISRGCYFADGKVPT